MLSGSSPQPRRRRGVSRMSRTSAAIVDAAVALAADQGWHHLAVSRVAQQAAVAQATVASRYTDRSGIGAVVWRERVAGHFVPALQAVFDVRLDRDTAAVADQLDSSLSVFVRPDRPMCAAAELLAVARYDPAVRMAVMAGVGPLLDGALTPRRGRLSRVNAARNAYLAVLALGLLVEARSHPGYCVDLTLESRRLAAALQTTLPGPLRLPQGKAAHLDQAPPFATGDPAWDALLQATVDEVGSRGFEGATVDRIAAASGHTKGLIFGRYPTKRDLFLDATARMVGETTRLNDEYALRMTERYSEGVAESALMRELMRPERHRAMTLLSEQHRLSWHDAEMTEAMQAGLAEVVQRQVADNAGTRTPEQIRDWIHVQLALGIGVPVLGDLHPTAWQLPFHVVTAPLLDGEH